MTMTTMTRRAGWQKPTVKTAKKRLERPAVVNKPYTAEDNDLGALMRCYGYLLFQPNGAAWLAGLVPKDQREAVAERLRANLLEAKAKGQPGPSLMVA